MALRKMANTSGICLDNHRGNLYTVAVNEKAKMRRSNFSEKCTESSRLMRGAQEAENEYISELHTEKK